MNLIKNKDQQNHSVLKFLPSSSATTTRRRHNYMTGTMANSDIEINNWKQNAGQSQVELYSFVCRQVFVDLKI